MNEHPDSTHASLEAWDKNNYWHAFTQMAEYEPFIIDRAAGCFLFDLEGNRYLDGVSSMWCNVHGHGHPAINAAIVEQLSKVAHVTSLGMGNPTTIALAKKLADLSPTGLEKVFFSSDGACAVEVALKMAFQYWRQCPTPEPQRDLFLAIGNAYHGDTIGSVSLGGVSRFHAMFDPLLFSVVRGPCPDTYRLPASVETHDALAYYLNAYQQLFERFSDRLVAVVIEPLVQGAAGMVMHPPGFLQGIAKLAKQHQVLLIADEIAVGVGRTGRMWACEWEGVEPDFLCTGKGLSGGYLPIAATLTTQTVWDAFLGTYDQSRSFFHGHTYGGNPLAAAAALATLKLFEQEDTLTNVLSSSKVLAELLSSLSDHPHVGDIRQRGLVAAVELVQDRRGAVPFAWSQRMGHRVCQAALQQGVWLRPLGNVLVIMPPLCVSASELELLVKGIKFGIEQTFGS